jgi:hypothetical protein
MECFLYVRCVLHETNWQVASVSLSYSKSDLLNNLRHVRLATAWRRVTPRALGEHSITCFINVFLHQIVLFWLNQGWDGRTYSTQVHTTFQSINLAVRDGLEDLAVDGKLSLKWMLKNQSLRLWAEFILCSWQETATDSSTLRNGSSGSINGHNCFD